MLITNFLCYRFDDPPNHLAEFEIFFDVVVATFDHSIEVVLRPFPFFLSLGFFAAIR